MPPFGSIVTVSDALDPVMVKRIATILLEVPEIVPDVYIPASAGTESRVSPYAPVANCIQNRYRYPAVTADVDARVVEP